MKWKAMGNNEDIDKFSRELQEQIMEQIRKRYSQAVIDHWQNPRNFRKIENPDGYAKVKGPCEDTMEMFIKIKEETISECGFQTDGCGTTIACGSQATELAEDKSFIQVSICWTMRFFKSSSYSFGHGFFMKLHGRYQKQDSKSQ